MKREVRALVAAGAAVTVMAIAEAPCAQKQGGILRMYSPDSPASMSIHEEATVFAEGPMMGVFNNLVVFDQHPAEQPRSGRARSRDRLVMERGWDGADDAIARKRQLA